MANGNGNGEPRLKIEWIVGVLTALSLIVGGVFSITGAEGRITTRLTTIETDREGDDENMARVISGYDRRIDALEEEGKALRQELQLRKEYVRHVHGHICYLLAKAHGPVTDETEGFCSLPEPSFSD